LQRRTFLQAVAFGAFFAALPAGLRAALPKAGKTPTVDRLEVFTLPVNKRGNWLIVRLGTDKGLTGVGDASHGNDADTLGWLKRFSDQLRGREIFDVEWFRQTTAPFTAKNASAAVAASALEQCLWDIMGKALGVPTYDLFGGRIRDRIRLYANINRSTSPRTPDGFANMASSAVSASFNAIKLAPFDDLPTDLSRASDVRPLIEQGFACAEAVRRVIGPDRDLLVDAHSRFTLAEGLDLAKRFEPLKLFWLEEVTPADPPDNLAAINRAAAMPTAGGESIHGVDGFYRYIKAGAVDVAMPDVKACGGMLELKKIAALAEAAGLPVSPHGPASPIGNVAAAQVIATAPNFNILEFSYGEVPWRAELISPAEEIVEGSLGLSARPGFGIVLNDRAIARHARAA